MNVIKKIFLVLTLVSLIYCIDCASHERVKRIVGGRESDPPPVDDPVVFVVKDEREAIVYGTRDPATGYYLFRGIRYALPPVGIKRYHVS